MSSTNISNTVKIRKSVMYDMRLLARLFKIFKELSPDNGLL